MEWTTEQLRSAMDALTEKKLVLEPLDGTRSASTNSSPALPKGRSPPLHLYSPENSLVKEEHTTDTPAIHRNASPAFQDNSDDSELDDLVTKLKKRAEQWKELTRELKQSQQRERNLQATSAKQAARIAELERKAGEEYILQERLGRAQARNQELKTTIRKYKEEARDNEWLQQRNQVLEEQLAEKIAEVEATKQALQTLASSSSRSKTSRDTYPQVIQVREKKLAEGTVEVDAKNRALQTVSSASSRSKNPRDIYPPQAVQAREKQPAEKNPEADAMNQALQTLPSSSSRPTPSRVTYPQVAIHALPRSRSREVPNLPASPDSSDFPMSLTNIAAFSPSASSREPSLSAIPVTSSSSTSSRDSSLLAVLATSSHSATPQGPHLSANPLPSSRVQSSRDLLLSVSPATSSHSTTFQDPHLRTVPTTALIFTSSSDSNLSPNLYASPYSRSLPKILANSASNSKASKDQYLPATANLSDPKPAKFSRLLTASVVSFDSKSSQSPEIPAHCHVTRPLESTPNSYSSAEAAGVAKKVTAETARFLEEKRLEREGQRSELKDLDFTPDSYSLARAAAAARRITQDTARFLEEKKLKREGQSCGLNIPMQGPVPSKRKAQDGVMERERAKRRNHESFWDVSDE